MKPLDLLTGIGILIGAFGCWGIAIIVGFQKCASSTLNQTYSGYPLCSADNVDATILLVIGALFFVVATVVLAVGYSASQRNLGGSLPGITPPDRPQAPIAASPVLVPGAAPQPAPPSPAVPYGPRCPFCGADLRNPAESVGYMAQSALSRLWFLWCRKCGAVLGGSVNP